MCIRDSPNTTPSAPSAPRYSRLRRSATRRLWRLDPRAFGARPAPPRLQILDRPLTASGLLLNLIIVISSNVYSEMTGRSNVACYRCNVVDGRVFDWQLVCVRSWRTFAVTTSTCWRWPISSRLLTIATHSTENSLCYTTRTVRILWTFYFFLEFTIFNEFLNAREYSKRYLVV